MLVAFLLGLLSLITAFTIWTNPNCQSIAFFVGDQTAPRTIPISCLPTGSGADAWALLFFIFGLIPIGYGIFLLLDEFGPDLSRKRTTAPPEDSPLERIEESGLPNDDGTPPWESAVKNSEGVVPKPALTQNLGNRSAELMQYPTLEMLVHWLEGMVDNPLERSDNWLRITHSYPAWSHISDDSSNYLDAWAINGQKLVMVRAELDSDGIATLNQDNVPAPSSLELSMEGVEDKEEFCRAVILSITAQFLIAQFYPRGSASDAVAGNNHYKTSRLAATVASVAREVNRLLSLEVDTTDTAIGLYRKMVLDLIPSTDLTFFTRNG